MLVALKRVAWNVTIWSCLRLAAMCPVPLSELAGDESWFQSIAVAAVVLGARRLSFALSSPVPRFSSIRRGSRQPLADFRVEDSRHDP